MIITAAHCCEGVGVGGLDSLKIVAGEHNLFFSDSTEQKRYIDEFLIHPSYESNTLENDICLLFLKSPLNLNGNYAKKLPLATEEIPAGAECAISGWGKVQLFL